MDRQPFTMSDFPEVFSGEGQTVSQEIRGLRRLVETHRTPALPSQELIDLIGGGDFYFLGLVNLYNVVAFCGLRPYHWVLEPGCGSGRNARVIAPLLDPLSGNFSGFDVSRPAITWCQESISPLYPNVRFDYADVRNSSYNPEGSVEPDEYRFPYPDTQFDIVFLPSVFTHMTRDGFEHYLTEIHRVMKPEGRLLSWHFLLDRSIFTHTGQGTASSGLVPYDDVSWVKNTDNPSELIAYDTQYVLKALKLAGFMVHARMRGSWDGLRPTGLADYQDRILSIRS